MTYNLNVYAPNNITSKYMLALRELNREITTDLDITTVPSLQLKEQKQRK